jgi:hypothetical protein
MRPGLLSHGVDRYVDDPLVKGVDLLRLGHSSSGADLLGHLLEALKGATGEEDPGPYPGPSRAKAQATAPPIEPPLRKSRGSCSRAIRLASFTCQAATVISKHTAMVLNYNQ